MSSRPRSSVLLSGALACAAWVGCGAPAPEAPIPDPDTVRLEGEELPDHVTGEIGGEAFAAVDVRYRITHGERRERVDLFFSDRHIERCGLPLARPDTLVWLRAPERSAIEVEELTTETGGLEVHYERPGEDGIEAVHRGVARAQEGRPLREPLLHADPPHVHPARR